MLRPILTAFGLLCFSPLSSHAQSLTGLRIEGPDQVIENTVTPYSVIAEFDNGMEFDVTLSASLSVEPGTYANIDVFGLFEAFEVAEDTLETIHASYVFGTDTEEAVLEVTVLEVPPAGFALDFDGTDDFVRIPSDVIRGESTLSFEAWFRTAGMGVLLGYQNAAYPSNPSNYVPAVYVGTDGRLRGEFYAGMASPITSDAVVNDDTWHHVALTAGIDTQVLYLDGHAVGEASLGALVSLDMSYNQIGLGKTGNPWPSIPYGWIGFDGLIDEVRVWGVARSGHDIRYAMNRRLAGDEAGLVGYWRFDDASGQYTHDSSGAQNDGFLGQNDDTAGDSGDPMWIESTAPIVDGVPIELDVVGPTEIESESSGEFTAIVTYEEGPPIDVTARASWSVDPPSAGSFVEGGILVARDAGLSDVAAVVTAEFEDGGVPVSDSIDVTIVTTIGPRFALDFDGTDDIVLVPGSESLAYPGSGGWTIEAWLYPRNINPSLGVPVAGQMSLGLAVRDPYSLGIENGAVHFRVDNAFGASQLVEAPIAEGEWTHVAGVYDPDSGVDTLYINGNEAAWEPISVLMESNAAYTVLFGGQGDGPRQYDGMIDEVRIWRTARDSCEIPAYMNRRLDGDELGLVGYWRLDEGEGQHVGDLTGFGNHGSLGSSASPEPKDPIWTLSEADLSLEPFEAGGPEDCNSNDVPDRCDLHDGTSDDCNVNDIPDECEIDNTVTLRSGNGSIGLPDEFIRMLVGPATGGFPEPLTSDDFAAARAGPPANIVAPYFNWVHPLSTDPMAQWISPQSDSGEDGFTTLYAMDFHLTHDGKQSVFLDMYYSVDNALGDDPYPGVFINGLPIPGNSTGGTHTDEFSILDVDITPLVSDGRNTLYVYVRNFGGPAGVLFSAVIQVGEPEERDCNDNDILDECDIGDGFSGDCNDNAIPDECEPSPCDTALDFDGQDDFVRVPRSPVHEPTDELTVEAWIHPRSTGPRYSRIVRNAGPWDNGYLLAWSQGNDSHLQFRVHNGTGLTAARDDVTTDVYIGSWHHVAGVFSATSDFAELYVDGVLKARTATLGPIEYSGEDLHFGNFEPFSEEDFDGVIDEVRIWNIARSYCEIRGYMNRHLEGDEPGLVGYWRMDEGSGQRVIDSSPFGNHGTLGTSDVPESNDPQWVESGAELSLGPFPPIAWTTPELVPEISTGVDREVSVSADGLEIYLSTERGGFARTDIYRAERTSIDQPFSTPLLVPELSVPGYGIHENMPCLSATGLRFYYMRHEGWGPGDFYVAERGSLEAAWDEPTPITSLNTLGNEWALAVSGDELQAVFISDRSGDLRYWVASRNSAEEQWSNFTPIDSLESFIPFSCTLTHDGGTLYVAAQGPTGLGSADVWRLQRSSQTDTFGDAVHVAELSSELEESYVSLMGDSRTMYVARQRSYYMSHFAVPGGPVDGEIDCDGDVDLNDYLEFKDCLTGPGGGVPLRCTPADFDDDNDVDLNDYARIENLFGAPH